MSKQFVINLNKTYSPKTSPIKNNQINAIDYSYNEIVQQNETSYSTSYTPFDFSNVDMTNASKFKAPLNITNDFKNSYNVYSEYLGTGITVYWTVFDFKISTNIKYIENKVTLFLNQLGYQKIKTDEETNNTSLSLNYNSYDDAFDLEYVDIENWTNENVDYNQYTIVNKEDYFNGSKDYIHYRFKVLIQIIIDETFGNEQGYGTYTEKDYNFNISIESTIYKQNVKTITNENSNYSLSQNDFINDTTIYDNQSIQDYNAQTINVDYLLGKQTINVEMPPMKLYNSIGDLVYDNNLGQIPEIGDSFTFSNISQKYSSLANKTFKIVKLEFNYQGYPKILLVGKEQ